ncbi:MAG: DUF2339 domain-containing protein [Gemmobacter sp.]|uniref:DUF2339 domain-containing protein n=1 Tax=Gemmobacter sp. TaxID=1898957 RepID=UPI001A527408|nr:DUF2339 domain-containing protein [Gemmobacter sp.]MBL8562383.1 DUF2339 domain-containing protein [Gemmobacter sp.]
MGDDVWIFWGVVALLVALAMPVLVIVLFVQLAGARGRLQQLEDVTAQLVAEVKRLRGGGPIAPGPESAPVPAPVPAPIPAKPASLPPVFAPAAKVPAPAQTAGPVAQDQPLVFRRDRLAQALGWLRENWAYAVAALSLALAGVFFVQYGIEKGLLPPPLRVLAALVFGAGLIAAGEWLRRRWGDGGAAGHLPSVFSGAGIVAIFAGIAAGRLMYGLYGPGLTFAGLALAAVGAIGLGWRYGPLLVAIGLVGAATTPFLVGGGGAAPVWLLGYYVGLTAAGLAVDAIRRWAWVSVLALGLGHLGLALMAQSGAGAAGWAWAVLAMALIAITLPQRSLVPDHAAPSVAAALWRRTGVWPTFPVRLATGNFVLVVALLVLMPGAGVDLLALLLLAVLAVLLLTWGEAAPGLRDLPLLAALGFVAKLALAENLIWSFRGAAIALRGPEVAAPGTVTLVLLLAAAIAAAAGARALRRYSLPEAGLAVLVAPAAVLVLEALWQPATVLGAYPWALHVMVLAACEVALAAGYARLDGGPGRRTAWATLAALSLIALALFLVLSAAALTLALAVLLVVAVALDRRFSLPEMGWFVQVGALVLSYRLLVDPGIGWAEAAGLLPVLASYLGVAAACLAGLRLMPEGRVLPRAVLESLGLSALALLVNVLILRQFQAEVLADGTWVADPQESHWGASLHALPWLVLAAAQLWRAGVCTGFAKTLRLGIAGFAGALAALGLAMAVGPFNPLLGWEGDPNSLIRGAALLDSLFLAYAVPGLLLLLLPPHLMALPAPLRRPLRLAGAALLVLYGGEEIRRLWQGPFIGGPGVMQGELYSYTLAMMACGAGLLWQAMVRGSALLRRVAMAVIALTVAKVFLWDASGLSGLVRVISFAGLGLALAALAWLNRWVGQRMS